MVPRWLTFGHNKHELLDHLDDQPASASIKEIIEYILQAMKNEIRVEIEKNSLEFDICYDHGP